MENGIVKFAVGGRIYQGWTSISITRSIEAISGRFNLSLTERWPGQPTPWPITPESECTVKIDDNTVITGDVDSISPRFDDNSHTINARGRDRTGRMVDCSAMHSPGEWANIKLDRIAKILAEPFGITVETETEVGDPWPLERPFKLQPGETAFEALDRACRARGVLPADQARANTLQNRTGAGQKRQISVAAEQHHRPFPDIYRAW
jgi:prophage tail gpP-like protein